jgi:hypothetical protein
MNMPSRDWSIVRLRTGIKPTHRIGDLYYVEHLKTKNRPGHLVLSGSARTGSARTVLILDGFLIRVSLLAF